MSIKNSNTIGDGESGTLIIDKVKTRPPKNFKVYLHNDDYTTMEFVIFVLQTVFHKSLSDAEKIMLEVHVKGQAVCGIFTYEIAETKTQKVLDLAKEYGHPLMASFGPE